MPKVDYTYNHDTHWYTAASPLDLPREGRCCSCGKVARYRVDRLTRGDGKEHSVRFWCADCGLPPFHIDGRGDVRKPMEE